LDRREWQEDRDDVIPAHGTVFVTGGAGLLGVNWAATVRERYRVLLGLHDRTIALRGVEAQAIALGSVDKLTRAFEKAQSFLVVHTAGITNVEACEADPDLARHVNVQLADNVAQACARLGIALAHVSTDHLFSGEGDLIREEDAVSPTNVYGHTKAEAESRVLDAHPGAMVVRTNFYGWGPSYKRSFSDTIIDGLRAGEPVSLFDDVTYTPILMSALVNTAHDLVDRKASGIFHVTGDDCVSKHQFGMRVARRFGLDANLIVAGSIRDRPELVARPRRMSLSNRKARALLGRSLGGIDEHLTELRRQETGDAAREIRSL
jgi:dTDP-4-dehydrorhamnose reductase